MSWGGHLPVENLVGSVECRSRYVAVMGLIPAFLLHIGSLFGTTTSLSAFSCATSFTNHLWYSQAPSSHCPVNSSGPLMDTINLHTIQTCGWWMAQHTSQLNITTKTSKNHWNRKIILQYIPHSLAQIQNPNPNTRFLTFTLHDPPSFPATVIPRSSSPLQRRGSAVQRSSGRRLSCGPGVSGRVDGRLFHHVYEKGHFHR